jgi:hypothetical protein
MLAPRSVIVNQLDSSGLSHLLDRFGQADARIQFWSRRDGLIHRAGEILDAARS